MSRKKGIRKYRQHFWRGVTAKYLVVSIVFLIVSVIVDLRCFKECFFIKELYLYSEKLCVATLEDLQDMVEVIWGIAITITIFILEISNQYHYGVSLKTVVNYSIMKGVILVGAAGYLMLYPFICLAVILSMNCTVVWCTGTSLITFGFVLIFSLLVFRKEPVRMLLSDLSIEKIENIHNMLLKNFTYNIHSTIDSLPLTDFIMHINYSNAEEAKCLVDVLSMVIHQTEKMKQIKGQTAIDMTLLMTWSAHIIYKSGTDTEEEKSRTIIILYELWEKLPNDNHVCYSVQMIIPFVDMKNEVGKEMIERFLKVTRQDEIDIIPYLLLYAEYRYWFVDHRISEWINSVNIYPYSWLRELFCENVTLDMNLAWNFWWSWRLYNSYNGQLGLEHFYKFCGDLERMNLKKDNDFESLVFTRLLEEE